MTHLISSQPAPGPAGPALRGNLPGFRNDRYNYLLRLHQEYGDVIHSSGQLTEAFLNAFW